MLEEVENQVRPRGATAEVEVGQEQCAEVPHRRAIIHR
jgi:hypothetical protein